MQPPEINPFFEVDIHGAGRAQGPGPVVPGINVSRGHDLRVINFGGHKLGPVTAQGALAASLQSIALHRTVSVKHPSTGFFNAR